MKKIFYLLLSLTALSCNKDDGILGTTTTVRINFETLYNGKPLVIHQPYLYPDSHKISFKQFNFFISDLVLLEAGSDDETDLMEVNFVDFSNRTNPATTFPVKFTKLKVPTGQYKGVRLSIGVPPELNKASAGLFGAGHPLRVHFDTHFWPAANSFMFMKLAGVYDFNNDGVLSNSADDRQFFFGPANNETYTTFTLIHPLELRENKPFDLNFYVDLRKLYMRDSVALDLTKNSNLNTQNPNDLFLARYLMGNFQQAIIIK